MRLTAVPASPPLDAYVEAFWFVRGRAAYLREKVLPNGAIELIINLGAPHAVVDRHDPTRAQVFHQAWLAGLQEDYLVIQAVEDFDLVGVRFRPGGAAPFLRFSPREVTNRVLECCEVDRGLADLADAARDRLLRTRSLAERVTVLSSVLLERIDRDWALDAAVGYALRQPRRPIGRLSREVGISHKHLISLFRSDLGTTPKTLMQIQRFQHALRLASGRGPREVDWAHVAQRCGYFDQAHLIRAFRRYSGATPSAYLRTRDDDENHMQIRAG